MSAESFSEKVQEKQEMYNLLQQGTERKLTPVERGILVDYYKYLVYDVVNNSYTNYADMGIEKAKLVSLGFKFLDETLSMQYGRKNTSFEESFIIELSSKIAAKVQSKRT